MKRATGPISGGVRASRFFATTARAHPRLILVLSLAAWAAGALSAVHLARRLDTDSLDLLPQDLPAIRALRRSLALFGSSDRAYVLATARAGASDDEAVAALEEVARSVPASDIGGLRARVPLAEIFTDDLLPRLPLLLDGAAQDELARRLTPEGIDAGVRMCRRRLALAMTQRERALVAMDPLGLAELLPTRAPSREAGLGLDPSTGALRTADGASFVMVGKPSRPATDIPFDAALAQRLDVAVRDAATDGRVDVTVGGAYLVALSDYRLMTSDLKTNMLVSLASVALLFLVAFKSGRTLAVAFVPLVSGILLCFLFIEASGLRLTSATLGFGAMLVGLGIDFSIVMIGRFAFLRAAGAPLDDALAQMCGSTLRGVATGAVTTAGSFLALAIAAFPALRQLGIVTAAGVMACLLGVAFQLPSLVARLLPRPRTMSGLGLSRLAPWSARQPRAALAAVALVTVVLATGLPRLRLEDDLKKLRSPANAGVAFEEELARRLGRATDTMVVLVRGASYGEMDAALDRTMAALEQLERDGMVAAAHGLRDLVPGVAAQEQRLAHLRALRAAGRLDGTAIAEALRAALAREGFRPASFERYGAALARALAVDRPVTPESAGPSAAMGDMAADLLARDGRDWVAQVLVQPDPRATTAMVRDRLATLVGPSAGSITITGFVLAAQELRSQIRRDAARVVPLGTVLVTALLWVDFKNVRRVLVSLLPIGLGLLWMLGLMGHLGLTLNFFNVFVLALVQGIGVDYGVHVIHRIEDRGLREVSDVGAGIVLAALTTVAGFGSLALSHYPALASMGIVTTFGTMGSLLAALTVVPAIYALRRDGAR